MNSENVQVYYLIINNNNNKSLLQQYQLTWLDRHYNL